MRLDSQSNGFIFNLPLEFMPTEIENVYSPLLKSMNCQYENVLDYINSSIKSFTFPGLSFKNVTQSQMKGYNANFKGSKNIYDSVSDKSFTVTFSSIDNDVNYWILFDIINHHYLDTSKPWLELMTLKILNIGRNGILDVHFKEIIIESLSDNLFDYSQQETNSKEFSIRFVFNNYNINTTYDNHKFLVDKNIVNKDK